MRGFHSGVSDLPGVRHLAFQIFLVGTVSSDILLGCLGIVDESKRSARPLRPVAVKELHVVSPVEVPIAFTISGQVTAAGENTAALRDAIEGSGAPERWLRDLAEVEQSQKQMREAQAQAAAAEAAA